MGVDFAGVVVVAGLSVVAAVVVGATVRVVVGVYVVLWVGATACVTVEVVAGGLAAVLWVVAFGFARWVACRLAGLAVVAVVAEVVAGAEAAGVVVLVVDLLDEPPHPATATAAMMPVISIFLITSRSPWKTSSETTEPVSGVRVAHPRSYRPLTRVRKA